MSQEFLSRRSVDEEQIETSRLLATIVWDPAVGIPSDPDWFLCPATILNRWWSLVLSIYAVCIPTFVLNRLGYTRFASVFLIVGWWAILTGAALTAGGIGSFAALYYLTLVFIAGLLLGFKGRHCLSLDLHSDSAWFGSHRADRKHAVDCHPAYPFHALDRDYFAHRS